MFCRVFCGKGAAAAFRCNKKKVCFFKRKRRDCPEAALLKQAKQFTEAF